jgi:hypothetical protein
VGASSWRYVQPWTGSVEGTFATVQAREFTRVFSTWPEEQRPADIAELWSGDEFDEQTWAGFMCAQGTHIILDVYEFVPATVDFGCVELPGSVAGFDAQADARDAAFCCVGKQSAQQNAPDAATAPRVVERDGQFGDVGVDEAVARFVGGR